MANQGGGGAGGPGQPGAVAFVPNRTQPMTPVMGMPAQGAPPARGSQPPARGAVQRWEYKTISRVIDAKSDDFVWKGNPADARGVAEMLTALGQEGWELVSVLPVSNWVGNAAAGRTTQIQFFFKRPVG
jgi:hypothetical protein